MLHSNQVPLLTSWTSKGAVLNKCINNIHGPREETSTTKSGEDYGDFKIKIRYICNCTQLIRCSRSPPIPSFLVYLVNPNLLETWTFWRPANLALARRKASTANWIFSSCQQIGRRWEDHEMGMIFRKLYIAVLYTANFPSYSCSVWNTFCVSACKYIRIYIYFMLHCALRCIESLSLCNKYLKVVRSGTVVIKRTVLQMWRNNLRIWWVSTSKINWST